MLWRKCKWCDLRFDKMTTLEIAMGEFQELANEQLPKFAEQVAQFNELRTEIEEVVEIVIINLQIQNHGEIRLSQNNTERNLSSPSKK